MASFHHSVKSGKKGSAARHANYIARQGANSSREDLVATGHGNMPAWAESPQDFWRAADKFERANGAVYREHEIALPGELTQEQQLELAEAMIEVFAGNKPYQYAIHANNSSLEEIPNTHMHLILSDRVPDGIERAPELNFRRYNRKHPEQGGCRKDTGGKSKLELRDKMIETRKRSAELQNEALARNGHEARVDHRTLKQQGIPRKPERHLGQAKIKHMSSADKERFVVNRRTAAGWPA